jgi:hypothetical protein
MSNGNSSSIKGSIIGRVISNEHVPLKDATVMITGNSPPHNDIALLTDSDGFYQLDELDPGLYSILISKKEYNSQIKNVAVFGGKESKLNFILK